MSRHLLAATLLLAALTGCSTVVKVLPDDLSCPLPDSTLNAACSAPSTLADGASFQALVQAGIDDRRSLRSCELRRQELAAAIRTCNQRISDYLAKVREINQANAAKP